MADQEVAKHTKNVFAIVGNKQHGIWHKVREIALEILVIVFAVSVSIWLHSLGEHYHEQQQVKAFMLGLKQDLASDVRQVDEIVKAYHGYDANFKYLAALAPGAPVEQDKFDAAYQSVNNNYIYTPQLSRYEGFKSSGKLTDIENTVLLEKIVDLYQRAIPEMRYSQGGWMNRQAKLQEYLDRALDAPAGTDPRYALITAPRGKRLCERMVSVAQLYERYQNIATLGKQIIKQIDLIYPAEPAAGAH